MSSTLKEAISSLKTLQKRPRPKERVSDKLLGKYAGIVPRGKTSTEFIRELRSAAFGKMKR